MKSSTRRGLLAKLGAGAAAITTVAVAGQAAADDRRFKQFNPKLHKPLHVDLIKRPETRIQVKVAMGKQGFVMQAEEVRSSKIKIGGGLTRKGKILELGVVITNGAVDVVGLESLANRVGSAAASSRCTYSKMDPSAQVINPAIDLVRVDAKALVSF
ncbi:MAG: hypothetical protein ACPG4T_19150 [Nannocystaceae bacterium]